MPLPIFTGTIIDASSLQYFPWRVFATMTTAYARAEQGPYRPKIWNEEPEPAMISGEDGIFVFDAVFRLEHNSGRKITENPVQNGAYISDHSYQLPASLTLDIGMSDSMDSYMVGQWGGADAKSVAAYEQIMKWQQNGEPLEITTRLCEYTNMVVENVSIPDDYKTKHGLKCMVTFKQIITAEVTETPVDSSVSNANVSSPKGSVSPIATSTIPSGLTAGAF